jgi:hypothetical protein
MPGVSPRSPVDQAANEWLTLAVPAKPSAVIDTRVIYCGDNLDQLRKLPDGCVDLIYIDPPFNSNRNYEVFWGETKACRFGYSPRLSNNGGVSTAYVPSADEAERSGPDAEREASLAGKRLDGRKRGRQPCPSSHR